MFFSVVIPTHKRKKTLENLLHSLKQQHIGKEQFEVIIVATENDEAFNINLTTFDLNAKIVFIPNDPLKGRSASAKRNFGASLAKAPWVAFIDDDCVAAPQWLQSAHNGLVEDQFHFAEGSVHIPTPERKTFTYKGIQRLSKRGGYQTCNMFYRKDQFEKLGGFDLNFPYYLEDTDLAWSFLDQGLNPTYLETAVVSHPVPSPAPKKMLESAIRSQKIPYLYKKHPDRFKKSKMRAYPRPFFILLTLDTLTCLSLFVNPLWSVILLTLRLVATATLLFRMLKGCDTSFKEVSQMFSFLLICPLVSFLYLLKGNFKHGVFVFMK